MQIRAPGLHCALHRLHATLDKGTDTIPPSHSHVRSVAPCRCPLPAGAGTRQRPDPRCGARLPVTLPCAAGCPCTCCSFLHTAVPFTYRPPLAPPPRRLPELLGWAPAPEPPAAPGCQLRAQRGRSSDPGVPGTTARGGDGKRKRWAARSRSRTLEEVHACGDDQRPPELGGRRAAACRREGYSEPRIVDGTRWY